MLSKVLYGALVVTWAITMLEFWKRNEKYIAMKWGMINFEGLEVTRSGAYTIYYDSCSSISISVADMWVLII